MGQATEERMTTQITDTRENLSRDVDALYDKVSPGRVVDRRKQALRGRFSSMKESVMGSASSVSDPAHRAAGSVQGAASSAADTAHSAVDAVEDRVEGAPLAAGLAAFGAGMVLSALIPASDKEAQAARRVTEAVKDSPVLDRAKAAGQEVGEHLKESATEAVDEVKQSAQESASHVQDEGRSAAQSVKEDAPGT